MELYEYFLIIRRRQRVLWMTIGIAVFVALVWQLTQGVRYGATLTLNIARSGAQPTIDYTYDGFYRLQADERFADTVVRWLGSPRGGEDILREAGMETKSYGTNDLARFFSAGRLSSQVIRVEYVATSESSAERISEAVTQTLNRYTDELNREGKDPSWFVIMGSEPVIRDARIPLWKALAVAAVAGAFFGFWFAFFAHYWAEQKLRRREQ